MATEIRKAWTVLAILVVCLLQFSTISAQTCSGDPSSMTLDDDFDGFSNGDETQNGTDKCSSLSIPADFDADLLSDLIDTDDDNDGIADITDKFAMDKLNGTSTNIPVYYKFQNPANGGIGNSGFTGLMTNGGVNYSTLYVPADIIIGGPINKFTVNNIPSGDALAAANSQKNGFQFGVNTGAFPFNYTISSRVMAPFTGIAPADFQSMGMFMGSGDQDNYLKIACASNGGAGGIEVVKEVAGVVTSNVYPASILSASQVNFYFTVNRTANTVQPAYSINGGAAVNIGAAIAVPSSWLSGVLAVGIISTSRGATAFSAAWDNIAVQPIEGNGVWQTVNTNNTCVPRHDCSFVHVGSRSFLLGGHGVTTHFTENYNFSSKLWATSGDVRDATPPEMIHHTQAVQVRGMIYMACGFGGSTPNDVPLNRIYMYDPPQNYWHAGREIPEARRRGASASVVYNEKIYIIGGLKGGHTGGWTNYLDEYDPRTNTWTILPDAPHERDHFQAVVHNGKIYCIGGRKTGFGGSTYAETVKEIDVYDIDEQTWSTLQSPECDIPTPRGGAAVGLIGDEIFVIGGENMSQSGALNTTEAFNVKTKVWRTVAGMNTGRHGTQAVVNNYAIYMVGGAGNRGESPDLSSVEVFYPYGQTAASGTAYTRGRLGQYPSADIAFGQVAIGTTSTKTITVANTEGTQAMIIKSIHLAQHSLQNVSISYPYATPFSLNPGDSIKIQVTFQPSSTSDFIGTLYVSNTGMNGDNTSFGITGKGVTQQSAVRINCTGPQFTTATSEVFAEDMFNQVGTTKLSTTQAISGTTEDVLFQTARSGAFFSYNIPVQSNTYTVKLHFAEIANNAAAGLNVFDVKIENSTKITALDLFATAGAYTAHTRTFTIPVTDQMMNLDFIASAGTASVSAIELIPAAVTQGVLTAVPMPLNFPETDLNANSAPITVTLTNTGVASLIVNSVSINGTNAANFVHTYGVGATTLAPGATKTFTVVFNPTAAGARTASLNIAHTGANSPLSITLKGTGSSTVTPCGYFVEQNGLLVMEVESQKANSYWTPGTAIPNYNGTEYYTWMGPNYFFEKGNGMLRYEFKVTTPGKYRFRLRSRHPGPDPTHFNDIWVRFPDHGATFEKNGQVMAESGTGWWIGSMATADAWSYNIYGLRRTFWEVYVEFKEPGNYYVDLSGRVEHFSIDRLVLYQMDKHTEWQACGSNPPQSLWEECPSVPLTWYRDKDLDDYGDPNVFVQSTTKPGVGWILNNQDCNDNYKTIHPGAPEILDGDDNDCDGVIDEGAVLNALNINCGGSPYTAVSGDVFESDRLYKPSTTSVKFYQNIGDILNTDDDVLYKSERFNSSYTTSFSYNMKATPGKFYKVSLFFAEQATVTNPGQRVFKVSVEDSVILDNFDIIATVGYKTAYVFDAYVYLRDSTLNIKFTDIVGKAKINAIKAAVQPNIPPTFRVNPGFPAFNEDFTGTKLVNVLTDPVLPHEAYQVVTYSLSPATGTNANVSINPATGQVSITSIPNAVGNVVYTIIANDGQAENNIATKNFTLKVLPVNDKPAFTMSGNVNVNKNFAGTVDVTATPAPVPTDEQSQVVTYSLSPASVPFANILFSSTMGKVSITSINEMYGTQVFTVTANDGMASNNTFTQTFTLTVNNINYPPTLDVIADVTVDEDAPMQTMQLAGISAGLGEMQTITASVNCDNASLLSNLTVSYTSPDATGLLTFKPAADKAGVANVTVTVSDGSLTFSRTFKVTVNPVNDAPVFSLSGDVTVNEDFTTTQQVTVTPGSVPANETSQQVTYTISPVSVSFANVSINSATGKVTITSIANENGSQLFTVTADDGEAQNNIATATFTLTVNAVNDAPLFSMSGDVTVNEDFAGTQHASVVPVVIPSDEITQTVTYSLSPASVAFANVSFNSTTGEVSIGAIADKTGSQIFTIIANDGQAQNNTTSATFTLTINSVNDAPVLDAIADVVMNEDAATQTVNLSGIGAGPYETQTLSVSAVSDNVSLIPNPNVSYASANASGSLSLTPAANKTGVAHITVTVSDGSLSFDRTVTVTVNAVNDAPTFTLSGNVAVNEDFATAQHVSVTLGSVPSDEVSQVVSYSLSPSSVSFAQVSINNATGEVTIAPIADGNGSQLFTITANDGQPSNNTATQTFTLTVTAVNDAPAFTVSGDITVIEGIYTTATETVTAVAAPADEQSQVVTYSLSPASVSFANISFNSTTGKVTITPVADEFGTQIFTVTANDGQSENSTSTQTFRLTVEEGNNAPSFTLSGDVMVNEDFAGTQVVSVTADPIRPHEQSQVVTYNLSPASVGFANISFDSNTGEVTITSIPDASGSQQFTITADDHENTNNTYAKTFTLTVNAVNDAPVFTVSGDLNLTEDFATAEQVDVVAGFVPADELNQHVTYSISPASVSFANVSINSSTGVVTVTSIADANGTQLFTITANDGQSQNNTHSATFTLTVTAVNDQPTLNAINNPGAVLEDSGMRTINLSGISAGGGENQTLTVTVTSDHPDLFSTLNLNYTSPATSGTIQVQPAPDQWGSATVTVTVHDGQATITRTFMVTVNSVNDVPKFQLSTSNLALDEDFSGTQKVSVVPSIVPADEVNQTVAYTLSPPSVPFANIVFNSTTGEVQITAVANASGSRTFTVMASDGQVQNSSYTETFVLTVSAVNDAPVFTVTPAITVRKNFTSAATFAVTPGMIPADEMNQAVTYSLLPATVSFANVSINIITGQVSVSSINGMVGSQQFTITANDQQPTNNLYSQQFTFNVVDTNYQPTLDAPVNQLTINEDAPVRTITLTGISSGFNEAQPLTVTAVSDNPALINPVLIYSSPGNTATLSFTPAANKNGVAVITITVDDGESSNNVIVRSFTVTVTPVNDAPLMNGVADVQISEDAGVQVVPVNGISAGPFETDMLTVTAVSTNPSLIANPVVTYSNGDTTGTLQFTPAANKFGVAQITVTTNDGHLSITKTFTVTIASVNDAPVVTNVMKQGTEDKGIAFEGSNFSAKYSDIESDPITKVQIVTLPRNGALMLNHAAVQPMEQISIFDVKNMTYEPASQFAGADSFSWNGFDGQLYAVQNAMVLISLSGVNDAPVVIGNFTNITVNEDAAPIADYANVTTMFNDIEDGNNLTYAVTNSNPSLLNAVLDANHMLDFTLASNANGSAEIVVTATDHQNASISDTFTVLVNPVEDVPSAFALLTPADGNEIAKSSSLEFSWEISTDGDNDVVDYSLNIKGHQLDTVISAISTTALMLSDKSVFTLDSMYTWFVTASDGDDVTVSAKNNFKLTDSTTAIHDPSALVDAVEAYPNPFNTSVNISYSLLADAKVEVRIMSFLGQVVANFPVEQKSTGKHKLVWNGNQAASGVYYYEVIMKTKTGMQRSSVGKIVKE